MWCINMKEEQRTKNHTLDVQDVVVGGKSKIRSDTIAIDDIIKKVKKSMEER